MTLELSYDGSQWRLKLKPERDSERKFLEILNQESERTFYVTRDGSYTHDCDYMLVEKAKDS